MYFSDVFKTSQLHSYAFKTSAALQTHRQRAIKKKKIDRCFCFEAYLTAVNIEK